MLQTLVDRGLAVRGVVTATPESGCTLRRGGLDLVLVRDPSQVDRIFALTTASYGLESVDLDPVGPPVQALVELAHRRQ